MTLFAGLKTPAADPIFALNSQLKADPRDRKLDLIVGVYRDADGVTPVFDAVHEAEARMVATNESKAYRGLVGNTTFNALIPTLVFDSPEVLARVTAVQSVGGTGALRLLGDFIQTVKPGTTIWTSAPGWGNHDPLFKAAGLAVKKYTYLNAEGTADGPGILAQLSAAEAGDAILIHGCCHNPSGADLDLETWDKLADLVNEKQLLPLIDLAYQGLGDGLDEDVKGLRRFAEKVGDFLVSVSCSKNFGLYYERIGAAIVVGETGELKSTVQGTLESVARTNYSMPPDHGAQIVATILSDSELRASWETELAGMRDRINGIRAAVADLFLESTPDPRLQAIRQHKGMFSVLPLTADQMKTLRDEHGVYGTDGGRINIAGLSINDVPYLVESVLAVLNG